MSDAIRPGRLPVPTPAPARPAAVAAQRAFFQAALNPVQAAAAQAAPSAAAPAARAETVRAVDPERPVRPGSLLDIRV